MDYQSWVDAAKNYFSESWGLDSNFAAKVALLYLYFASYGLNPTITSGLRSAAKQAEMLRRWNSGDRAGMKFKPAVKSAHTKGKAVDITTNDPQLAAKIAEALGIGAGYSYGDPVHFFQKG